MITDLVPEFTTLLAMKKHDKELENFVPKPISATLVIYDFLAGQKIHSLFFFCLLNLISVIFLSSQTTGKS